MARTALFSRLQSVVSRLGLTAARASRGPEPAPGVTRRQLLRAGAGLGLAACGPQSSQAPLAPRAPSQRVAVIGGGLAGLHCAFRLAQAGVDVTVYEANSRIGGRTFTGRRLFRDTKLTCEFGAEFIDSDHLTMLALVEELALARDERYGGAGGSLADVYYLGGTEVSESTIESQLGAVAPTILAALARANSDASVFRDLDNSTLASFFEQNVPAHKFPELLPLLETAFRGEFGLEPEQQSALNLIHLMVPGADAELATFGKQGAQFRARLGADSFATAFFTANALRDRVKLNSKLASIRASSGSSGSTFSMTFETKTASGFAAEAEHVVFALPFSVLRQLDLTNLALSEPKRKLIRELGYGTHSKLLGAFSKRIWREKSGTVSSDLPFQQVWDGSIGQGDPQGAGLLCNLVGGEAGETADLTGVQESMAAMLMDLNRVFMGVSNAFIADSALRMHWPSAPLFRGSCASYLPGQWALRGNEGRREGNVHFCGEHCSADFQGRMEGAVETGALVAARLLDDLHVAWPAELDALLAPKLVVPQPCYDGKVGAELGFLERRATLARQALPHAG